MPKSFCDEADEENTTGANIVLYDNPCNYLYISWMTALTKSVTKQKWGTIFKFFFFLYAIENMI